MKRLIMIVLFCFGMAAPAVAASAFFYSDSDEYYGWGAGYDSYSRAEAEARDACVSAGGASCQFALGCSNGYGSIAYADDSAKGVGMACGFNDLFTARIAALAVCMHAAQTMCWTESAFTRDGTEVPPDTNAPFDLTYFIQQNLYILELTKEGNADGELGPQTRAGIMAFQEKLGLPADGEPTIDLLWRLLNASGGPQHFADGLYEVLIGDNLALVSDRIFAKSSEPDPKVDNYSVALTGYTPAEQRLAVATILNMHDRPCTLPAISAEPIPADGSGGWNVECKEDSVTLLFGDGGTTILPGLTDVTVAADGTMTFTPRGKGPGSGGSVQLGTGAGGSIEIGTGSGGSEQVVRPPPGAGGTGRTLGH